MRNFYCAICDPHVLGPDVDNCNECEWDKGQEAKKFLQYLLACAQHSRSFDLGAHVPRIEQILGKQNLKSK